jgi:ribosomal protein S18 acetylase RimI-like enzyme
VRRISWFSGIAIGAEFKLMPIDHKADLFRVRKAALEDVAKVEDCLKAAFDKYRSAYTADAFADTVPDLIGIKRRLTDMCLLVAVAEGRIVGTIACDVTGSQGHLRGMAVLPDWHGTEVAAALLREAENELRQNSCTVVTLDTTEPLKRAIRFYEKHGFVASGKLSDFFGMRLHEYSKRLLDCAGQTALTAKSRAPNASKSVRRT